MNVAQSTREANLFVPAVDGVCFCADFMEQWKMSDTVCRLMFNFNQLLAETFVLGINWRLFQQ